MNNATNFTANDRLRVIGAKALTGTFVKYYAAASAVSRSAGMTAPT